MDLFGLPGTQRAPKKGLFWREIIHIMGYFRPKNGRFWPTPFYLRQKGDFIFLEQNFPTENFVGSFIRKFPNFRKFS